MNYAQTLGAKSKAASAKIAAASPEMKNSALRSIADAIINRTDEIISANALDLTAAAENGMSASMQDRLRLTPERIKGISDAVRELIAMDDPIGSVISGSVRPNGLRILKTRVPLGCIGIIFESRPNVTVDAATLCLKAGNAVLLRGGKEAIHSNTCLTNIMREAVSSAGLPADCIQLVEDTSRETAADMMKLNGYLDVLIPRGGAGLIQAVVKQATVPVIETGAGNCHVYIDKCLPNESDFEMAVKIVDNAKTQRPSVCNAIEGLVVHEEVAEKILPMIKTALDAHDVVIYGDEETARILGECVLPATEEIYDTEFNDYKLSVKVVSCIDEALAHIAKYSTKHSECIITKDMDAAERFKREVDAAAVYVNASTRFTDGGEFGYGAEIGISTQKLHARGPMGLNELTTVKYIIDGCGQIR
ncbi:MAG: glutamate-5-semialdehyde dehydrogenase [Oscillospiraceae bacterium]|nr:glutamate-5-semialdehyde dehydrogenase [Oscillospiraceae bacterium]